MNNNFQNNITSISDALQKNAEASTTSGLRYNVSQIPLFIQTEATKEGGWGIDLQAEVNRMNGLLERDNFMVNVSAKLVEGLRRTLLENPSNDHSSKTTQFGLIMYLYLAIEKLYFGSSTDSDSFTDKLFGSDPFAENLAIIRILWDIFCKWYIEFSGNDPYAEKLKKIDEVMTKPKLDEEGFDIFKQIFEPEMMLGFIIWLKAYYIPLLDADTKIMQQTREVIDGTNKSYITIINDNENIDANYEAATKELDKIKNYSINAKNDSSTDPSTSASAPASQGVSAAKKMNMTAAMIAQYYIGSVLAFIHKRDVRKYQQLSAAVEKKMGVTDSLTDVSMIKQLYTLISKEGVHFSPEDVSLLSKTVIEGDVLSSSASSTVFFSIVNNYLRIKNFLKGVVAGESNDNSTHLGDPIHLLKGLSQKRGMLLKSSSAPSVEAHGGATNTRPNYSMQNSIKDIKKQAAIKNIENNVQRLNHITGLKAVMESVNSVVVNKNINVRYFAQFDLSNMPVFSTLGGKNYVIVAVTENANRVVPCLWINYPKGSEQGRLYKIVKTEDTQKIYDLSFDPTLPDASELIGSFQVSSDGYGTVKFESEMLQNIPVDHVNPDDVSKFRSGYISDLELTKTDLDQIISDLSLDMHVIDQKEKIYSFNVDAKLNNGGVKSFHICNMEDGEAVNSKPEIFNGVVEGRAADINHCGERIGQYMVLDKDKAAEHFLDADSYESYPKLLNGVFVFGFNGNYYSGGKLNYDLSSLPLFLHFFFLLRTDPGRFRSIKKAIKKSFNNLFQKPGKIVDIRNPSIISTFREKGCAETLSDLVNTVENTFGKKGSSGSNNKGVKVGFAASASDGPVSAGGAKKVVKRIAKKIASKRGKGRGRGSGGVRGSSRGRGRGRGHR